MKYATVILTFDIRRKKNYCIVGAKNSQLFMLIFYKNIKLIKNNKFVLSFHRIYYISMDDKKMESVGNYLCIKFFYNQHISMRNYYISYTFTYLHYL